MSRAEEHARYVRGVAHAEALDPRIVDAMVRECDRVGMSGITEENWPDFVARSRVWRRLMGKTELAPEDVRRFIGLATDAPTEDLASWAAQQAEDAVGIWAREMREAQESEG